MSRRTSARRTGVTLAVAIAAVVSFGAVGGTGLASSLAKPVRAQYGPGQYQYTAKVMICHKGRVTITVGVAALPAHLRHGDAVGACAALAGTGSKAQKPVKATKPVKAAKAAKPSKAAKPGKPAKPGAPAAPSSPTTTTAPVTSAPVAPGTGRGNGNGKGRGPKG